MASTQRITREAEGKIVDALGEAKSLMEEGLHPDEAITKAAELHELPAGHVRLMVQAYNTARTNRQRRDSEDVFEKAGEFDVADAAVVIGRLYPTLDKSAGAREAELVSDDYGLPPAWFGRLLARDKAARALPEFEKAAAYETSPDRFASQAHSLLEDARREEAELSRQLSATRDKLAFEFNALENYFRRPGCVPFEEVADNAAILWGKTAEDLMHQIGLARARFAKQASWQPPVPVDERREPYSNVAACVQAMSDYHIKKAALGQHKEAMRRPLRKLAARAAPPRVSGPIDLDDPDFEEKRAFGETLYSALGAAMGSSMMGQGIQGRLGGKTDEALKAKAFQDVTDPAHEQRIRGLQSQAALHDMLANDEVISSYQPEDVMRVYNEVGQIAPRAAGNPMLMRALIRKHLAQGQLDTFDISQLTGIESNLKDRDRPMMVGDPNAKKPGP